MCISYYWFPDNQQRPGEEVHIGKSLRGWYFWLEVYPAGHPTVGVINTLADWRAVWDRGGSLVRNEDVKSRLTPAQMEDLVRNGATKPIVVQDRAAWLTKLGAEEASNGLVRLQVGPGVGSITPRCIGHGTGLWDYCVGNLVEYHDTSDVGRRKWVS